MNGTIRRRAARLAQLGLVRSCTLSDDGRRYTVVTAAGDVAEVATRDMPAYLQGLAHGAYAQANPMPEAGKVTT